MLSIARSKSALLAHVFFIVANTTGLVLGVVYHSKTPELYENNAHNKLGWIATWIVLVYVLLGFVLAYTRLDGTKHAQTKHLYERLHDLHVEDSYRYSQDSGHGTDSTSPRLSSLSSMQYKDEDDQAAAHGFSEAKDDTNDMGDMQQISLLESNAIDRFLSRKLSWIATSRASSFIGALHNLIDRAILILGFIVLATGIVTYGGIFVGTLTYSALKTWLTLPSAVITYSMAWPISSKAVFSSGMDCSALGDVWALSRTLVGLGTSSLLQIWLAFGKLRCHRQNSSNHFSFSYMALVMSSSSI